MRFFSSKLLNESKKDYYKNHYIASVQFKNGRMVVADGKRDLIKAKMETMECYVKDIQNKVGVKLVLKNNEWERVGS